MPPAGWQSGYVEAFLDRHRYAEQRLVRSGRRAVHRPGGFERAFEVADHHRIDMRIETFDPRDGILHRLDRKSVVEGKSVSVRVELGGRRIIKKNNSLRNHVNR